MSFLQILEEPQNDNLRNSEVMESDGVSQTEVIEDDENDDTSKRDLVENGIFAVITKHAETTRRETLLASTRFRVKSKVSTLQL